MPLLRTLGIIVLIFAWAFSIPAAEEPALDDLLKWSVDKDGVLWVSPNPGQDPIDPKSKCPLLAARHVGDLFAAQEDQAAGPSRTLWDVIKASGVSGLMNYFCHGGLDLASMTDAETHFRKLSLGLSDEELIKRIRAKPQENLSPELAEREALDRLLAVRLCGTRRIKAAGETLRHLAGDIHTERFLKDAAKMSATLIEGGPWPLEYVNFELPELLRQYPENISYLLIVNPAFAPLIERPFHLARIMGMKEINAVIQTLEQDLAAGQRQAFLVNGVFAVEQVGEMNYELARQVGNLRLDHILSAGVLDPATGRDRIKKSIFRGIFPVSGWRKHLDKRFLSEENGRLIYRPTEGGPTFVLHERTILFEPAQADPPGSSGTAEKHLDEIRRLGAEEQKAVWCWVRNARPTAAMIPKEGPWSAAREVRSALLKVHWTLERTLVAVLTARCDSPENAEALAVVLRTVPTMLAAMIERAFEVKEGNELSELLSDIKAIKVSVQEAEVSVSVALRKATPENLLLWFANAKPRPVPPNP